MFLFTDDCIIGIEELDNEHRRLFELMHKVHNLLHNEIISDRYDQIKELVAELEDYADIHFKHEEDYMKKLRDPELVHQRVQHDFFRDKMHMLAVANIGENEDQIRVLEELVDFLAKWLYHHIIGSDIMIGHMPPLEEWMLKENPCEFTEEYLTGNELIDGEHKQLFALIEKIYRMAKNGVDEQSYEEIRQVIEELKNYTIEHFADEEEFMESIHYEGLEAQKRAHESFVAKVTGVDFDKIEGNAQRYVEELTEFLLKWLIRHILHMDKKIPVSELGKEAVHG